MGRYTLKVRLDNNQTITVNLTDNGVLKEKVSLMTIDNYTIGNNPRYILKNLGFNEAELKGNESCYISYISQGKEKNLNVLFNDAHNIKKIANSNERLISNTNPTLINFIDNTFLPLASEEKFINFLKKNHFITAKLEEWLREYIDGECDLDFCYSKIIEHSANYKQFRGLVVGVELYKNHHFLEPKKDEDFLEQEIEDDIDHDKDFGLYSEEELRKYAEYLESLPEEIHPHDRRFR